MTAGILILELLGMILVGWAAVKRNVVGPQFTKDMANFITGISLPCLIITSLQMDFSMEELKNCGRLLLMALLFLVVSYAAGLLVGRMWPNDYRRRITRYGMLFTNFTFMGVPVVESLYGQQMMFYFMIFLVPLRIALYLSAKPLLTPPGVKTEARKRFGWVSPPLVGVAVGLLLYITGWKVPAIPWQILKWLGSVCSPMGMVLCGMTLAAYPLRDLLRPRCFVMAAFRCLLMPGLLMGLALLLHVSRELTTPMVITAALPVGSLAVSFTLRYDDNPLAHFDAAGTVLVSTLFSAAAIPLWARLLEMVG